MSEIDPVLLTSDLIKCQSVTPEEAGAIDLLEVLLRKKGFACSRISRGGIENLFARWGTGTVGRSFAYDGHTDVVQTDHMEWKQALEAKAAAKPQELTGNFT